VLDSSALTEKMSSGCWVLVLDSFLVSSPDIFGVDLNTAVTSLLDAVELSEWYVSECVAGDDGTLIGGETVEEVKCPASVTATSLTFGRTVQFTSVVSPVVSDVVRLLRADSVGPCGDTVAGSES